eukprot:4783627-Karenia_brevis.AAC.1
MALNLEFKEWAFEAAISGGSIAHGWARSSNEWQPDPLADDGLPADTSQAANSLMREWTDNVWKCSLPGPLPRLVQHGHHLLSRPSVDRLRKVSSSFKLKTGVGADCIHPRHVSWMDDAGLE